MPSINREKVNFARYNMWRCEMMNETKLIGAFFKPRQKALAKYASQAEAIQNKVLQQLVAKAENTEWGLQHDYRTLKSYQDFQQRVPVHTL